MAKKAEGAKKKAPKDKPLSTGDLAEALKLVLPVILKNVQAVEIRGSDLELLEDLARQCEEIGQSPMDQNCARRLRNLAARLSVRP